MIEHVIPFYNLYSFGKLLRSDEPFAKKVQAAAVTGGAVGSHLLIFTRSALQEQNMMLRALGHSSGPTHGWGTIRALATSPVARGGMATIGVVAAGAGISYAIAGEKGVDDYNEFISEPKHYGFRTSWALARLIEHLS